ncbi:MAG: hypothetical protein FJW78_03985 [Actinobacteria bacterium]|nr:hypothetical protein [Actinomycetota bacterium]
MYAVIVGGGKVGANLGRALLRMGHEVSIVEARPQRYATLESEFEHMARHGDGTEIFVLDAAGMARADVCIAVTGDDEDNIIIGQVARDHFGVENVVARVNDPRNQQHFDLLGVAPTVCATESILSLIEHEGAPALAGAPVLAEAREPGGHRDPGGGGQPGRGHPGGRPPDAPGTLVISVLRNRVGRVAAPDTVLGAGDQVVVIAEPGQDSALMELFASE